ncbi:MAG TPA: hypothetical protein VGW34_03285 [Allosphingosinicella sp.]|nr:hypothetical protein [Allosphingosinicella sp.]
MTDPSEQRMTLTLLADLVAMVREAQQVLAEAVRPDGIGDGAAVSRLLGILDRRASRARLRAAEALLQSAEG